MSSYFQGTVNAALLQALFATHTFCNQLHPFLVFTPLKVLGAYIFFCCSQTTMFKYHLHHKLLASCLLNLTSGEGVSCLQLFICLSYIQYFGCFYSLNEKKMNTSRGNYHGFTKPVFVSSKYLWLFCNTDCVVSLMSVTCCACV